ncbi:hypothetical protein DIZ48_15905 [Legionella pneumophila]|nr:hypothetical protein A5478_03895 [Legionella pneumophila]ANH15167.1 hypothetical protein A5480_03890 [Legionella pneumophila]ANH18132.1 hypothetical protein A5479_03890 [Legionella pneumophila]APX19016.1 hypothetical protein A1D14_03890 [Legionella pneumophila]AQL11193.1 hypothetical protein A1D13_03890 [Legionella pneumophila]
MYPKKLIFGAQSEQGSRFIERIFSVVATYKQQKKMSWHFSWKHFINRLQFKSDLSPELIPQH